MADCILGLDTPTPGFDNTLVTSTDPFHRQLRHMQRSARSLPNRLRSIAADVAALQTALPALAQSGGLPTAAPVFANLRCGAWYAADCTASPPDGDGATTYQWASTTRHSYFKSTDGHYGKWAVSRTRINLHLVETLATCGGAIVVDATQHGKRYPDSFSKTVPLWAHCVNIALCTTAMKRAPALRAQLPPWVSDSECSAMEQQVPAGVALLRDSGVALRATLAKPVQCRWAARDGEGIGPVVCSGEDQGHTDNMEVCPLLLVSASGDDSIPTHRRGWAYVAGAGDDEEAWASSTGLSAAVFHRSVLPRLLVPPGQASRGWAVVDHGTLNDEELLQLVQREALLEQGSVAPSSSTSDPRQPGTHAFPVFGGAAREPKPLLAEEELPTLALLLAASAGTGVAAAPVSVPAAAVHLHVEGVKSRGPPSLASTDTTTTTTAGAVVDTDDSRLHTLRFFPHAPKDFTAVVGLLQSWVARLQADRRRSSPTVVIVVDGEDAAIVTAVLCALQAVAIPGDDRSKAAFQRLQRIATAVTGAVPPRHLLKQLNGALLRQGE